MNWVRRACFAEEVDTIAEIAGGYVALDASDSIERWGGRGGMAAGVVTVDM
jgi:hypothetical protein